MRRILILLFFCFAIIFAKAQVFSVGDTTCNYTILNDSTYLIGPSSNTYSFTSTYTLDVDGDLAPDLIFDWYRYGQTIGSSWHIDGTLKCTSPNGYEVVNQTAVTGGCSFYVGNLISNLTLGTPLTASSSWSLNPTNSFIYSYKYAYFSPYTCGAYPSPYNGNTSLAYLGFRKILSGDTIYGWLKLYTGLPGVIDKIDSYAYMHTASNPTVTTAFTSSQSGILCAGSPFNLTANPSGGTFYGPGVIGNVFNPGINGGGNYTVYYNKYCSTASMNLSVTPAPIVAFTNTLTSVCNGSTFTLTANPIGGSFSGTGVSGNVFYSSFTGLGTFPVSYSYTDGNGCSNTKTVAINVVSIPSLTIASTSTMSCPGQSVILNVNGASSYTWSTGSNNQNITVNPNSTTIYSVTGEFASGSCPSGVTSFTQAVGNPTVTITSDYSSGVCSGYSVTLKAFGASSYSWSTGSTSVQISVLPFTTTTFSVIGTNPGGCTAAGYFTQTVVPSTTITAIPNQTLTCKGDTVIVTLSGSTNYIISCNSPWYYQSTSNSTVGLTPTITATYTISASCSPMVQLTHSVSACVGINELNDNSEQFVIFPNPSSGESEIKGIKEETIFISNELGQLIATKYLTKENSYSVKLDNLQSGVYFVGSKFYRQKVVVIK